MNTADNKAMHRNHMRLARKMSNLTSGRGDIIYVGDDGVLVIAALLAAGGEI